MFPKDPGRAVSGLPFISRVFMLLINPKELGSPLRLLSRRSKEESRTRPPKDSGREVSLFPPRSRVVRETRFPNDSGSVVSFEEWKLLW